MSGHRTGRDQRSRTNPWWMQEYVWPAGLEPATRGFGGMAGVLTRFAWPMGETRLRRDHRRRRHHPRQRPQTRLRNARVRTAGACSSRWATTDPGSRRISSPHRRRAFITTKPDGAGHGLGPDIAQRIVLRHRGEMRIGCDRPARATCCCRRAGERPACGSVTIAPSILGGSK